MVRAAERTVCFKVDNFEEIERIDIDVHTKLDDAFVAAGAFPRHVDVEKQICCVDIYDPEVKPEAMQAVLEKFGFHARLMETNPPLGRKFSIEFTTLEVLLAAALLALIVYFVFVR